MKPILFAALSLISCTAAFAQANKPFGKTIIAVAPVVITENTPTGFGLQIERFVGARQHFSLYLPLAYSFGLPFPSDEKHETKMVYAYPGLKWYPSGSNKKLTYSLGVSGAIGAGRCKDLPPIDCPVGMTEGQIAAMQDTRLLHLGFIVNNGLNLTINRHYYAGAEAGLGWIIYNRDAYYGNELSAMLQGNLKFGYRF